MELFDLVNEKDEAIGITDSAKSHRNGLLHRVIAVFVFSSSGKLYVQIRDDNHLLDHSVGGHVGRGESYDQAVKREAFEELRIKYKLIKISCFFSDETFTGENTKHIFSLYECIVPQTWKFKPTFEVKKIISISLEQVVKKMNKEPEKFTGGFINTMREYIIKKKLPYKIEIPSRSRCQ